MKVTIIQNGTLSMCLSPETELEVQAIKQLFQGPVDTQVAEKTVIMDKSYQNAVIISAQAAKKEEV